jgi:hypothetical protein
MHIKMQIIVTSCELYQPKSAVPWRPADAVLSMEVVCKLGCTLEQVVTYVAAVQWLIPSKVALKHQQHKATYVIMMYTNFILKLTFKAMAKHNSIHTREVLSTQLFYVVELIIDSSLLSQQILFYFLLAVCFAFIVSWNVVKYILANVYNFWIYMCNTNYWMNYGHFISELICCIVPVC